MDWTIQDQRDLIGARGPGMQGRAERKYVRHVLAAERKARESTARHLKKVTHREEPRNG